MQSPNRIKTAIRPDIFENLGNGNWYYNYDIVYEGEVPFRVTGKGYEGTQPQYSYIQVKMAGKPDYKRCVEAIIREFISQSQEFDLINSFNTVALGMATNESEKSGIVASYTEYLDKVAEIKTRVKEDFK